MEVVSPSLTVLQRAVRQRDSRRRTEPSKDAQRQQVRTEKPHKQTARQQRTDRHPTTRERLILIQPETRVLRVAVTCKHVHQRPRKSEDEKAY